MSESNLYTSKFIRDNETKFNEKNRSYKIQSNEYNDAMFYQKLKVKKNTPYKVTCMVKTKEVQAKDTIAGVGAQISIEGTTERSVAISGTKDWQKIELIFNSKDRESVNLGFRLGGYLGDAKGEAWFSDFTMEEGLADTDKNWKFACFIFKTTDVTVNDNHIKLEVTRSDINDITSTIKKFEDACIEMSYGKMSAQCDIYEINTPLNQLSYDQEFGYYVSPEDIEEQIKQTISENNYDHIYAIIKLRR